MRVEEGEGTRRTAGAAVWPWLIGLNGVAYLLQHVEMGSEALLDRAVPTGAAIDAGELWRPFTSLLVHPGGPAHLAVNSALLLLVGPAAQRELGSRGLLVTYFGIGCSANALRYAVGGRTGGGASAAIFAIAGATGARWLRRHGYDRVAGALTIMGLVGGLGAAGAAGDNHVLALGLGAACTSQGGPSAAEDRLLVRRVAGIVGASALALVVQARLT